MIKTFVMSSNQDDKISKKYPLHLAIWNNNLVQIKRLLSNDDAQVIIVCFLFALDLIFYLFVRFYWKVMIIEDEHL